MQDQQLLQTFVDAWNNKDISLIVPYLKNDFHYSSFYVYDEITSAAKYLDYLSGKFQTIQESGSNVRAFKTNCRRSIFIQQDDKEPSALILEIEDGVAVRADMMPKEFAR